MSPSAAPKRSTEPEQNDRHRPQKRPQKLPSSRTDSDPRATRPVAKRRRLNPENDASESSARAQLPLAPRSANTRPNGGSDAQSNKVPTQNSRSYTIKSSEGIKQPSSDARTPPDAAAIPSKVSEARSLRSKDAARPKSDLSKYFPDFDDIVCGETPEDEYLSLDTVLNVYDDSKATFNLPIRSPASSPNIKRKRQTSEHLGTTPNESPNKKSHHSRPSTVDLDLVELARRWDRDNKGPDRDALADELYKPHRRAERQEKQARNTDRERAMHEKSELERLLAELKGPDWLRALGISGITETQKRGLESTRDLFISRVIGLLERFAAWKDREKELRLMRQRRLRHIEGQSSNEGGDSDEASEEEADSETAIREIADSEQDEADPGSGKSSHTQPTARRKAPSTLKHRKTKPGSGAEGKNQGRLMTGNANTAKADARREERPPSPLKTFFAKKHQRSAAFAGHRRGRNVIAFGQPIPEMHEKVFQLPDELYPGFLKIRQGQM